MSDVALGIISPLSLTSSLTCLFTSDTSLSEQASLPSATDVAPASFLPADHTYHDTSEQKSLGMTNAVNRRAQYLERRRKNNVASKRSRETRKHRLMDQEEEVGRLEQVNAGLRQRVAELERATQLLRSAVVDAMK